VKVKFGEAVKGVLLVIFAIIIIAIMWPKT
jgi:hypothetical protein